MKVYVDEMPNNCGECPCLCDYEYGRCCNLDESIDTYKNVIPEKCPLQLLSDHDKEVRKQVCDEIRQYIRNNIIYYCVDDEDECTNEKAYNQALNELKEYLDQIEKGE